MKIIVDTSVWVDFFNGNAGAETIRLRELIKSDQSVCLLPVIIQEILQGLRSDESFTSILSLLDAFPVITFDPIGGAIGAARLYRDLRKKGITIRKSNDCLIAFVAITTGSKLLFKDRDFDIIATHTSLQAG